MTWAGRHSQIERMWEPGLQQHARQRGDEWLPMVSGPDTRYPGTAGCWVGQAFSALASQTAQP